MTAGVDLGARLFELRDGRSWTQRALEEKSGVSHTTIAGIETGRITNPRTSTLRRLARAFGMSLEEFTEGKAPKVPMTTVEEVLRAAAVGTRWAALSDEEWGAKLENEDPRELLRSVEAEREATQDLRRRLGQSEQATERQLAGRMIMRYLTRAAQAAQRTRDPEAIGKVEEAAASETLALT